MSNTTETLTALLQRYHDHADPPVYVPRVKFFEAVRLGDDPLHILPYMAGIGLAVHSLDDLLLINTDETEDELRSFRVAEGVAVTIASDGSWLLFEP